MNHQHDACGLSHDFPAKQDFCTHLGHETLGAHSRHYICRKCGTLMSIGLSTGQVSYASAAEAMQFVTFMEPLRQDHQCVSGWRGHVVVDLKSTEQLPI